MSKKKKKIEEPKASSASYVPRQAEVPLASIFLTYTAEDNPNRMDKDRFAGLKESVRRNEFLQPVLLREDADGSLTLIDGHHRYEAVKEAGHTTIAAVIISGIDPLRGQAIGLGLNRYRGDQLLARTAAVLSQIQLETDMTLEDIAITSGFDEKELDALLNRIEDSELELPERETMQSDLPDRPFVLEVRFAEKADYQLVRKKLKKAAGPGGDLARGLLSVLGEVEGSDNG